MGIRRRHQKQQLYQLLFRHERRPAKKANWHTSNFGVVPTFKAGLHLCKVTTGEIGALKKEIIFTGDVLNTTARIQNLCNQYMVDILISEDLKKDLQLDDKFQITSLGITELKGKEEKIEVSTVLWQ